MNAFKLVIGVINSTIVPKALGPKDFGDYQFLFRGSGSIRDASTFGTTAAFFTYSSKNVRSGNAFLIFLGWNVFQLILVIAIISASAFFNFRAFLYPDQSLYYIVVVSLLDWTNYVSLNLIQFGESKAENVYVQKINFYSNLVKLVATTGLYLYNVLDLNSYIVVNYIGSLFIVAIIMAHFLKRSERSRYFEPISLSEIRQISRYFIAYCSPLIVYNIFGFVATYFDRWFLEFTSGSVEQAYFAVSFQWANISLLFTTSVLNIFWREISFSLAGKDFERVRRIYTKSVRSLFFCQQSWLSWSPSRLRT